jgi:hypothetical protein
MKTATAAFQAAMNKSGNSPRTLLVFNFPAPTGAVYASDGPWNTGAQVYLPLVMSWQPIYKQVNPDPLTFDTSDWKLTLANTGATPFSAYFAKYEPLSVRVDVYHWFDGLADSDKLLIDSFVVSDVTSYDSEKIELDLVSLIEKYENQVGNPINTVNYPYADPKDIGEIEPIVYGIVNQVPVPCVLAGGVDAITDDPLTASTTTMHLTNPVGVAPLPTNSFTALIDGEQIAVAAGSGATRTITRGQGGTTAAAHSKGTVVREKRSDFTFIAAGHPISSIDGIFVKVNGNFVKLTAGYTLYTGQPGSQHPTWPNKAIVVLSSDWARLNAQAVASSYALSDPGHTHSAGTSSRSYYGSPYTPASAGQWYNNCCSVSTSNLGTIQSVNLIITMRSYTVAAGSDPIFSISGTGLSQQDTHFPNSYATSITRTFPTTISSWGTWSINCEIWNGLNYGAAIDAIYWEVVYIPMTSSSATGMGLNGSANLSGTSAMDSVLSEGRLYVSMHGVKDDGSGTYTGTPNALIQNPIYVISHFVQNYGAPAGCCDVVTFSAASASLASAISGGYAFSFAWTKPVSFKAMIARLAFQCRCRIWMEGTTFKALFRPKTARASLFSVTTAMMGFRSVKVSYTAKDELVDDMKLSYNPDWSKGEPSVGNCLGICDRSATYPVNNGIHRKTQWELMEMVPTAAMASDLRDFYIWQYGTRRLRIDWSGFSQAVAVERFDVLDLNHDAPVFGLESLLTETENVKYYPGSGKSKRGHRTEFTSRADFTGWDAVSDFDSVADVDAII